MEILTLLGLPGECPAAGWRETGTPMVRGFLEARVKDGRRDAKGGIDFRDAEILRGVASFFVIPLNEEGRPVEVAPIVFGKCSSIHSPRPSTDSISATSASGVL